MNDTLALVLAGGRGSRLGPLTDSRAKPAVPIGGRYRIIDFTLSNCLNSGVPHVGILTQYLAHTLVPHLDNWSSFSLSRGATLRRLPARSEGQYAGTADAIYQNRDVIRTLAPSYVLVLAADHVYKMDYAAMLAEHQHCGATLTVACMEVPLQEAVEYGVMEVDGGGRVLNFVEKPQAPCPTPERRDSALASMGIYIFDTAFLLQALAEDAVCAGSTRDFGRDVIPAAVASSRVHAYRQSDSRDAGRQAYWRDVGTLDSYWRTNLEIVDGAVHLDTDDAAWPIHAMRGVVAAKTARVNTHNGCVIFPDAQVEAGSVIEKSVVLPGARIGGGCVIRNAIIDERCYIPPGTAIGVDPACDRSRFLVSASGVTLVAPAMVYRKRSAGSHPIRL